MIRKSIKYFLIAFANLLLLTFLLSLWSDDLERTINNFTRPIEFLKILGITFLSLVCMRILVYYFRKKNISNTRTKLKMAALLIFLVSSYLYVDYSSKVMHNLILNRQFRSGIAVKIKPTRGLAFGTTADSLTIKEYQEITEMNWFPKVPNEALNIGYDYSYDGFLPDYVFTLIYYIPKEMKVDTIDFESGDFSRTQTFEIINNYKRVSYCEGEH